MVTTNASVLPVPSYNVESPVPLSETHHGPAGVAIKPQGFTRLVSLKLPTVGMSELRLVTVAFWAAAGRLISAMVTSSSKVLRKNRELAGELGLSMGKTPLFDSCVASREFARVSPEAVRNLSASGSTVVVAR